MTRQRAEMQLRHPRHEKTKRERDELMHESAADHDMTPANIGIYKDILKAG